LSGGTPDLELVAYGETIEPYVVFGTSILRYVREGRWKYIHKVEPELFDVARDPAELKNLAASHPEIVERLRTRLFRLIGDAPSGPDDSRTSIDPATAEQLEALGYLAAAPTEPLDDEVALLELLGVDPMELTGDVRLLAEAAGFTKTKIFDKSAERYRVLVERHPESVPLLSKLAASLEEIGADEERFALLPRLMELSPEEPGAYIGLAHLTFKRGDQPEAERLLLEALTVEPCSPGARATLAHLAAMEGDHREQIRLLKEGVDECSIAGGGILNS
jgi:tetratricopeptide (TPR) repeat protein